MAHIVKEQNRIQDERLARIEGKIDKLSDAMINLARAEEKLINIEKNNQQALLRMNKHSERMDELESIINEQAKTVKLMQYILSIASTLLVGAVLKIFFET